MVMRHNGLMSSRQSLSKTAGLEVDAIVPFTLINREPANAPLSLLIYTVEDSLSAIGFQAEQSPVAQRTALVERVVKQLERYFDDTQWLFDISLHLKGTDFQHRLWFALCDVLMGISRTYGQLADCLNRGAQAVGQACRCNPVPVIVPCHRLVSQSGMGGYAGVTGGEKLDIKRTLLAHEGAMCG